MTHQLMTWRKRAVAAMTVVVLACGAGPRGLTFEPPAIPAGMPKTPLPDFKGCSSAQEAFLKDAWRQAHFYTWRTDRMLDRITSRSEDERAELWSQDHVAGSKTSPSPRTWFGAYNRDRAEKVRDAVGKALARFEKRGQVVKGIGTVRCGRPIAPAQDVNVDKCPSSNPGGSGAPSAYHFPVGTVVTCDAFWDRANGSDREVALDRSARTLVHEAFHWLSVDGKYVTDYHGDGVNGQPDQKYYGPDNALSLAEKKPSWAIYNNDNYALFASGVGAHEPTFSAVFVPKEGDGMGGFYLDMTWESLAEQWKKLGQHQYLADVETYVRDGQRRYTAVWRVGKGNGALWAGPWTEFAKNFAEWKKTQDLIDIEVYESGGTRVFLGVFRHKQGTTGDSGLLAGLTWQQLVDKRKEFADKAWLADVETYVDGGSRKFVGVWRVGKGVGALYWFPSKGDFDAKRKELSGTKQLVDYERFLTGDGKWNHLGVWRADAPSGALLRDLTMPELIEARKQRSASATLVDVEAYSALPSYAK